MLNVCLNPTASHQTSMAAVLLNYTAEYNNKPSLALKLLLCTGKPTGNHNPLNHYRNDTISVQHSLKQRATVTTAVYSTLTGTVGSYLSGRVQPQ